MEWLALDARLDEKKSAKLRCQKREFKRQQKARDELERQQRKLAERCAEMHAEELLSIAMEQLYARELERKQLERKREGDMQMFRQVDIARKRAQSLGLPLSTPGVTGLERLRELEARIAEKEAAMKRAAAASQRLDALPHKRSILRRLMTQYRATALAKQVERALNERECDRLVQLLDASASKSPSSFPAELRNYESANCCTPVLAAIYRRKPSALRRLLELGASPAVETSNGMTPLLASVVTDSAAATSLLLTFHVDVNYKTTHGVCATHVAAEKGRIEVLVLLLRNKADPNARSSKSGRTPLIQAVIANQLMAVTTLLAFGADCTARDTNGNCAADFATRLGFFHMHAVLTNSNVTQATLYAQLLADEENTALLPRATLPGNRAVSAMHSGSQQRALLLETAMRNCDLQQLRLLLEDPIVSANYEDTQGNTPLLIASRYGTSNDVRFCLAHHALPLQQNRYGTNALMQAAYSANPDVLALLLAAGVDLRTRDFAGDDSYRHLNANDHADVVAKLSSVYRNVSCKQQPQAFVLGELLPVTSTVLQQQQKQHCVVKDPRPQVATTTTSSACEALNNVTPSAATDRLSSDSIDSNNMDATGDNNNNDDRRDEIDDDNESEAEAVKRCAWQLRQRYLKHNRMQQIEFETERMHILEVATRSRRNGLVAPLRTDVAGHNKLPLCDNCGRCHARLHCIECEQVLCDKCHARLHDLAQRRHHTFTVLAPTLYVGHEPLTVVLAQRDASLTHSLAKSQQQIASIHRLLLGDATATALVKDRTMRNNKDPEVERFERSKRRAHEQRMLQMPLNVPVATAQHAAQAGDSALYTTPSELELVDLYISQKRFDKANALLVQLQQLVGDALGVLHPTALKIAIGRARVQLGTGDAAACVDTIEVALALFESVLPVGDSDLLLGLSVLLTGLETLARYEDAVRLCHDALHKRCKALGTQHSAVVEIETQRDEFVAKRELLAMTHEDAFYNALLEQSAERSAVQQRDKERRIAAFRHLVLDDPSGLADFLVFCRREFTDDLVTFWIAVERYKQIPQDDAKALRATAVHIFLTYIKARRVKVVTAAQRKRIKKAITTPGRRLAASVFGDVQQVVFDVVFTGIYARFLASQQQSL